MLHSDPPEYPEVARSMKIEGTVHLEVEVRRDGTIKAARVLGGHPVLAEAFLQAIKRWKYEPASEENVEQASYTFDQ
ncbi:MAG: energy transducer TonB [Terriglobales bacterium]